MMIEIKSTYRDNCHTDGFFTTCKFTSNPHYFYVRRKLILTRRTRNLSHRLSGLPLQMYNIRVALIFLISALKAGEETRRKSLSKGKQPVFLKVMSFLLTCRKSFLFLSIQTFLLLQTSRANAASGKLFAGIHIFFRFPTP